jgi:alpha-amylase/alpha-mannosidase (GH57 family)
MERYICIHGHFYQPPRENAWLEAIELQDSAHPYHDWNERITAESYATNGASRILDGDGRIVDIVSNYSRISFNFGPTLLSWMEDKAPDTYEAILSADKESQERFSGHGSAMAQVYNHIIMPLANPRDKRTQVLWGIRDFERRFGRRPEGMWLSETAVDLETLGLLADEGIKFTILAPSQAAQVRPIGGRAWTNVGNGRIDPSRAYLCRLPSQRSISLFFYDGPISQSIAFEGALRRGEDFTQRLTGAFSDQRSWPQLVHVATDGETYGHHHRHGDMALAYALHHIETNGLARLTNYGEYLEKHPPTHEVQVQENTTWSCAHGVERWRSDCGDNSGGHPGWSQAWRAPLRGALDWLRDALAPLYEDRASALLRDPWGARDAYIAVVMDRSVDSVGAFLREHAVRELSEPEATAALKLLEIQRQAMLMYTSCGWFFDELSGIETVQVIQYAGRAIQLAHDLFGGGLEDGFLERLSQAKSNIPDHGDGRVIYEKFVKPALVDWERVGAHYAVTSLFEEVPEQAQVYSYDTHREDYQTFASGRAKLSVGRVRLTSQVTRESALVNFGFLHLGDHNVNGGAGLFETEDAYLRVVEEVNEAFQSADFPEVLRVLDRQFGESTYSLRSLFRDEQRAILGQILASALGHAVDVSRLIYETQAPVMHFMVSLGAPLPRAFQTTAELYLSVELRRALVITPPDGGRIAELLEEARTLGVEIDTEGLAFTYQRTVESLMDSLVEGPEHADALEALLGALGVVDSLPFEVDLWTVQNRYFQLLKFGLPEWARDGAPGTPEQSERFHALGRQLGIRVE